MKKASLKSNWVPSHPLDLPPDPGPDEEEEEEEEDEVSMDSIPDNVEIDEVYRETVLTIKDIVSTLDIQTIVELVKRNHNNLESALEAALALSTAQTEETTKDTENLTTNHTGIVTSDESDIQSISELLQDVAARKDLVQRLDISKGKASKRGCRMKLPSTFLACPRYRLIWNRVAESFVEFTVIFNKRDRKLGLTVQESNTEIIVVDLQDAGAGNPCLAEEAGVMEGDAIIGINGEMFSPWAELQDVIELLNMSGVLVTVHFHRRLRAERLNIMKLHPSIPHFIEQNVISNDKARVIDKLLASFKRRVFIWDDQRFAEKIDRLKASQLEAEAALPQPTDRRLMRRSVSGIPAETPKPGLPQRPASVRWRGGSSPMSTGFGDVGDVFGPWMELKHVRPALAVRILRTETSKTGDYTVYVIWVLDVKSGQEWIVRRRFREFFEFRENLLRIRPSLKCLDFPPKRMNAESTAVVQERIPILQKFLRKICSIGGMNEYHPSSIRVQLLLQAFLAVEDKIDAIFAQDSENSARLIRQLQVFIHSVLYMAVMDKVIYGFVDSFLVHQVDDVSKVWTMESGTDVLEQLKSFLDHIQNFIFDCFAQDCKDIIHKFHDSGEATLPRASKLIDQVGNILVPEHRRRTSTEVSKDFNAHDKDVLSGFILQDSPTKMAQKELDAKRQLKTIAMELDDMHLTDHEEMVNIISCMNEDEVRSITLAAIRKQVEIEIYLGCYGRLTYVLQQSLKYPTAIYNQRLIKLRMQPQTYFGIPINHISPSGWIRVLGSFRKILSHSLPYDKIECLLQVPKEIITLYHEEHPKAENSLGADEMLPIFIYIIVQAAIPNLLVINHEIQFLCDTDKKLSESGYYLATLEASLSHIMEADLEKDKPFNTDEFFSERISMTNS